MLSETYLLWQALDRADVNIPREHPRVKSPGKTSGPCLRIRLDKYGITKEVEIITDDEWPGLWTVREGNQNSFPVVRITQPLLNVDRKSEIWRALGFDEKSKRKKPPEVKKRLSTLENAFKKVPHQFSDKSTQDWKRLSLKAEELLRYAKDADEASVALRAFAERFQKASADPKKLLEEMARLSLQRLGEARLDAIDPVELLLVGKGPADDNEKRPPFTVQLAFDLTDERTFKLRLYSNEVRRRVKVILPVDQDPGDKKNGRENKHPGKGCAYSDEHRLRTGTFPKVYLPALKKEFPLVSMFSEAGCNKRYGLTDSLVVPVGEETALLMQDALTWIVNADRRGKTWRSVANGKFEMGQGRKKESFDLLIVYVDGKPEIHANIADLFGTDESEQQKQFEVDAQAVCKALEGVVKERPGSKLNLFLLRKASEGQAHVVVAESLSVEEVLDAAKRWQRAATNVPDVILPLPGKAGEKTIQARPRVPYPDQIVRLLSEQWVVNGLRSNKTEGIGLGEVLYLMLRKPGKWQHIAQRMLDLTVRRLGPLLQGVFGATHTDDNEHRRNYPPRSLETALRAVTTTGILLDAIGRRKEAYMSGTAFLIGRLLSLADTLHREYCRHVRDGSIPPQLIGNALMPAAADNPRDAVDRLRERMMIYQAWATKADGEGYGLAKWAVGQIGKVCQQLSELGLPIETDQAFRAELFLGYMARPGSEKDQDGQN